MLPILALAPPLRVLRGVSSEHAGGHADWPSMCRAPPIHYRSDFAQVKKRSPSANKRQTHDDHNPPLSARQATPSARQATPSLVEERDEPQGEEPPKPGDPTVSATTTDTLDLMRVATWNVNSVKQRIPRLLPWLDQRQPDIVCLQETKLSDDAFHDVLGADLAERGYEIAHNGQGQWNGALLNRVGLDDAARFRRRPRVRRQSGGARAVSAVCGGVRVYSLYVLNGREPDSPHYIYKLDWLAKLGASIADPASTMLCGDINIAPTDADVYDPASFDGHTHVTAPERDALAALEALGLTDVVRRRWPGERVYSYWDYRAGMFHKDLGMRIDLDPGRQ